jgi:hypothetical protein
MLDHVIAVLEELGLQYAIGGSVAAMAYGDPRGTMDADIVVRLRLGDLPSFLSRFPAPEFYVDAATVRRAVLDRTQFNIVHAASAWKADIYLDGDYISNQQLARPRRMETDAGYLANFSPPEELIIKKMEAYAQLGSEKHLSDVVNMLKKSSDQIDTGRVKMLADEEGLAHVWQAVLVRMKRG